MPREESRVTTVVVSSATGTALINRVWDVCRWWRVIPPSELYTYTVTIYDGADRKIIERSGQIGTLSENLPISLGIAGKVTISAATGDGTYSVIFDMH